MAETISIGAAAARVVASIGVLFDRIMDSADEYAEALAKLGEPEAEPVTTPAARRFNVGDRVRLRGNHRAVGKIFADTEDPDDDSPYYVVFDGNSGCGWFRMGGLELVIS